MALFKKDNLPIAVPMDDQTHTNPNNLSDEARKIVELSLKTNRTTSGLATFTSNSSGVEYSNDAGYANQGEDGLLKLLINRFGDTDNENIPSFLLTADNFNDVVDAIQAVETNVADITSGATTVARAATATTANTATSANTATTAVKLANTSVIGSTTQPVYFTNGGVPQVCTSYANATVGTANRLSNTNAIGSASQPVYFTNGGVPEACTMANLSVGTASKLGSANKGSSTKPIYLNAGTPAECSTYAGGTAVTLNGASYAGSAASFYAPTASGSNNNFLKSTGSGAPSWVSASSLRETIGLGSNTGTLAVANGGTGKSSWTVNRLVGTNPSNTTGALVEINMRSANTANAVVIRDGNGDFAGRNITASGSFSGTLSGTATNATKDSANNTISEYYCHVFAGDSTPSPSTGKVGDLYIVI